MKSVNKWSLAWMIFFALISCKTEEKRNGEQKNKPNLLIVFSDQHSYDMLGAYGNTQVLTPNIDAFAAEGIRFDMAFSNQPVCTPFRGMLMSGMHPLKKALLRMTLHFFPIRPNSWGKYYKKMAIKPPMWENGTYWVATVTDTYPKAKCAMVLIPYLPTIVMLILGRERPSSGMRKEKKNILKNGKFMGRPARP